METRDIFIIGNIEAKTDVTQLIPSQPNPVILDLNTLNWCIGVESVSSLASSNDNNDNVRHWRLSTELTSPAIECNGIKWNGYIK